eukprot:GHRR01033858.1.p1 GENE.GHRR01033858.1~~GHRR01033858.1.p1  ORF type:complete len:129 (-),score=12.57 GHRR01033858.1:202-588(-)
MASDNVQCSTACTSISSFRSRALQDWLQGIGPLCRECIILTTATYVYLTFCLQDHYDFGMRAVKSVLVMAGGLKRANPDLPENVVLIRAMRDSNLPKFLVHDVELFSNIIADLFPGVDVPNQVQGRVG